MNRKNTYCSVITLMLVLVNVGFADAPAVDATAVQQAVATQPIEHHWYDGPLTQSAPQQQAGSTVPTVTSAEAQSELVLPSVSAAQSSSGVTPTLAATDAVVLPRPPRSGITAC